MTVRAAWFGKRGQLGGAGVVRAVRTSALVPPGLSPGLAYETFVRLFERMPAFDAIPADGRGVQAAPDIGPIDPAVPFAVQWRGWLRVDQPGTYTFTLGSDDGGVLWLYDAPVVDNDGQHAYLERSGAARLGSGYHPLRIGYYNALGARDFKVWIEGPGLPRQPLSGTLIWHEER